MKKVVYIHGSYDLKSEADRDAFNKRKAELSEKGFIVYTPFELCLGAEGDTFKCNRLIVRKLTECDHIHFVDQAEKFREYLLPMYYPIGVTEI